MTSTPTTWTEFTTWAANADTPYAEWARQVAGIDAARTDRPALLAWMVYQAGGPVTTDTALLGQRAGVEFNRRKIDAKFEALDLWPDDHFALECYDTRAETRELHGLQIRMSEIESQARILASVATTAGLVQDGDVQALTDLMEVLYPWRTAWV